MHTQPQAIHTTLPGLLVLLDITTINAVRQIVKNQKIFRAPFWPLQAWKAEGQGRKREPGMCALVPSPGWYWGLSASLRSSGPMESLAAGLHCLQSGHISLLPFTLKRITVSCRWLRQEVLRVLKGCLG